MDFTLGAESRCHIIRLTESRSAERAIRTSYFRPIVAKLTTSRLTTPPAIRRLSDVETTATGQRPAAHVVRVVAGGLATMLFVDLVLGLGLFDVVAPALVADVFVFAAVAFALKAPPRTIAPAAVLAASASVAVSIAVAVVDSSTKTPVMGYGGAWPGFAELAGLGLLTAWSVRSSSRQRCDSVGIGPRGCLVGDRGLAQSGATIPTC